jgi:CPA1 family monovalent cation:H+ antiporter
VLDDGSEEEAEELLGRMEAAQAALRRLEDDSEGREDTVQRVSRLYEFRYRRFSTRAGEGDDDGGIEEQSVAYQQLMHRVFEAQRIRLVELRNQGQISNAVMHRLERELDLEESRLEV